MNTKFCDKQTFNLFEREPREVAGFLLVKTVCVTVLDSSSPSNFPMSVACLLREKSVFEQKKQGTYGVIQKIE